MSRLEVVTTPLPLHVTEVLEDGDPGDDGPASGRPTFLLVHGYGGSSFSWRKWRAPLARRGRVLQIDMKGFGDAPKPNDGRYRPTDLAELIVDLARHLDLERLVLIGHSLGGGLSLLAALRLRDMGDRRLERLVLVAAPAYRQKLPPFVAISRLPRLSEAAARAIGLHRIVRGVLRSIVVDDSIVTEEQVRGYTRPLQTKGALRSAMDVGRTILPADIDEIARRYPEIDVPTLLLWGDSDRVVPLAIGERLAEALPNARLVILPECGHLPPEELPEESFHVLADFLDEDPSAGRTRHG